MASNLSEYTDQAWADEAFCEQYAKTWEISTDEVHFGWLSPGENTLNLLAELNLMNANVLDVGCGMGENLIALSKKGARCFGVDISKYMLKYARERSQKLFLAQEDMRSLSSFPSTKFNLILSVYSLEYLTSAKEFRDVLASFYNRLMPGGLLVFCFSHPLQHIRHSMLRNETALSDLKEINATLIYSFKDVILALTETGFIVERVLEQHTFNPSQIDYEDGKIFPYHFRFDQNPCRKEFDKNSNGAPHTVIYKAKKPDTGAMISRQMSLEINIGKIRIWGEERQITDTKRFACASTHFTVFRIAPIDSVIGICNVISFKIEAPDIKRRNIISLNLGHSVEKEKRYVKASSLLGIIAARLRGSELKCYFEEDWLPVDEFRTLVHGLYISRIDPVFGEIIDFFPNHEIGLLIFVNGEEPGGGKVGAQNFFPAVSDQIDLVYVILKRGSAWTYSHGKNSMGGDLFKSQLDLFGPEEV